MAMHIYDFGLGTGRKGEGRGCAFFFLLSLWCLRRFFGGLGRKGSLVGCFSPYGPLFPFFWFDFIDRGGEGKEQQEPAAKRAKQSYTKDKKWTHR